MTVPKKCKRKEKARKQQHPKSCPDTLHPFEKDVTLSDMHALDN
jgi:hypothetical protein